MAKATAKKTEITVGVTLELTPEEALVLRFALEHIGGNPKGPRGLLDGILSALWSAKLGDFPRYWCVNPCYKLYVGASPADVE